MSDQFTTTGSRDVAIRDDLPERQLVAFNRAQMQEAQTQLVEWAQRKRTQAEQDRDDASAAKTSALAAGFDTTGLNRMLRTATKRVEFFEKMQAAAAAGYAIIPDLPVDVFAVRTNRQRPLPKTSKFAWDPHEQTSEAPPAGQGEYHDALPTVSQKPDEDVDHVKRLEYFYFATDWQAVDFPMIVAKPQIIERVNSAMSRKFFDEIGVLPGRAAQKGDPVVVGIIKNPVARGVRNNRVMFLIAWYVDTREI